MSELRKEKKIKPSDIRVKKKIQEDKGRVIVKVYYRKIIKSTHYCDGKKKTFYGVTFEANHTDRSNWLIRKIENSPKTRNCSESRREFGYDDQQEWTEPPFTYPDYEVGEE